MVRGSEAREDRFYTDTDSVVLSEKLPDEVVSSSKLGMFKLEYVVKEAIFLAPKSYWLSVEEKNIIVHKGAVKPHVSKEWYINQYIDRNHYTKVTVTNPFTVDFKTLSVRQKTSEFVLTIPQSIKRDHIYDSNGLWVDTTPKRVEISETILRHLLPLMTIPKHSFGGDSYNEDVFSGTEKDTKGDNS